MENDSHWKAEAGIPRFGRLDGDLEVDVAIIGGGITGVTAAYLLAKAGRTVALLERDRLGGGDTDHTTAHLTYVTDLRLHELVNHFGRDHAQAVWDAGRAAIDQMDEIIRENAIECDFTWVPGYLHAPRGDTSSKEIKLLEQDVTLAAELGFESKFLETVPFVQTAGVRFANQAKFHPLKYLAGVLKHLPANKCHVFENSEASEVEDSPLCVNANGFSVTCDYLIIATHVPLQGKTGALSAGLFQSKLTPYSSYAIGAKIPRGIIPEALFWDTADPYQYLRVDAHARHDYAIFGGEDHKTGQDDNTRDRFNRLEELFNAHVSGAEVRDRWSGQVIETNDGLPLLGETAPRQFVATGYSGNGMTFGTLGAMMARDRVLGRKNPWQELFDVDRKKLIGGAWDYIKENLDYPYYMIKDRLTGTEGNSLRSVNRGEGKILTLDKKRVAVYRDQAGKTTMLSPLCTHLGCVVHWNSAEATWDCPCHGSRFKSDGQVLAGPAESPLEPLKPDQED